jgi:hypothetical protein
MRCKINHHVHNYCMNGLWFFTFNYRLLKADYISTFCICLHIDGQVRWVRLVCLQKINFVCFFINKRTNNKLPFAPWANSTRIKKNCLSFCFPLEMAAYVDIYTYIYSVGWSIVDCFLRASHRCCWGLWAERLAKPMGGGPSNGIHVVAGTSGPLSPWRWLATELPLRALSGKE